MGLDSWAVSGEHGGAIVGRWFWPRAVGRNIVGRVAALGTTIAREL